MSEVRLPPLDGEGQAAPPRRNGELTFEAPWEGRVFGIAVALAGRRVFDWEGFREGLIGAISEADRGRDPDVRPAYYESWLEALERLLLEKGVVERDELLARREELAAGYRDPEHPEG